MNHCFSYKRDENCVNKELATKSVVTEIPDLDLYGFHIFDLLKKDQI